jgi:DNA-binding transcriptional LysR family regulator
MDKLIAMTTFVQIADSGSLTAAAERLGTSLPTVVRALAALEEALGVRLMNRTTRKVTLTDEGRHYLERCRSILADIEDAELALTDRQGEPKGKLVITAPVMFGKLHVRPIVTCFMQEFAQIRVDLLLLDRIVNLIDEGIDVAIRIGHLDDSSMVARQVGLIRQVVCASPALIGKTGVPERPEDLINANCIRVTGLAPGPNWRFQSNGKPKTIPVNDTLVCNQIDAAIDACVEGIGFGVFLSYQVESLVREGKLVCNLTDYEPPPLPVSVIYSRPRLMSTRVRTFVDRVTRDLQRTLKQ